MITHQYVLNRERSDYMSMNINKVGKQVIMELFILM